MANWRSDLKKILKMAGAEYKQVAFLFTDLQIKEDTFLEDISENASSKNQILKKKLLDSEFLLI